MLLVCDKLKRAYCLVASWSSTRPNSVSFTRWNACRSLLDLCMCVPINILATVLCILNYLLEFVGVIYKTTFKIKVTKPYNDESNKITVTYWTDSHAIFNCGGKVVPPKITPTKNIGSWRIEVKVMWPAYHMPGSCTRISPVDSGQPHWLQTCQICYSYTF